MHGYDDCEGNSSEWTFLNIFNDTVYLRKYILQPRLCYISSQKEVTKERKSSEELLSPWSTRRLYKEVWDSRNITVKLIHVDK